MATPGVGFVAQGDMPTVSVIIVNYNTAAMLYTCLLSLRDVGVPVEVIVVDNASSDTSVRMVREQFPEVRVIANTANKGFGVANNQGVAQARGRYVLLLNSDTLMLLGALERMVAALEHAPDVALVGPTILGYDGAPQPSTFCFPRPLDLFVKEYNLLTYLPAVVDLFDRIGVSHTHKVDWLLGACVLGRREQLRAFGPFDPRFFMYAEDIDLAYRLRQEGWKIQQVPDATIMHWGGYTSRLQRVRMAVRSTHSMYLFYRLHYSAVELLCAVVIFRVAAALRLVWNVVRWMLFALARRDVSMRRHLLENVVIWRRVLRLQPPVVDASRTVNEAYHAA